ncbi:MAG: hypothetical protein P1U40_07605 [Coxiellaceae bacterium]|nr:hypothetical protein [Coxiellaceae bacterium]
MRLFTTPILRLDVITKDFAAELAAYIVDVDMWIAETEAAASAPSATGHSSPRTLDMLVNIRQVLMDLVDRRCLAALIESTFKPRKHVDALQVTDGDLQMGIIPRDEITKRLSHVAMALLTQGSYSRSELIDFDLMLLPKISPTSATPLLDAFAEHINVRAIEPLLAEKFRSTGFIGKVIEKFGKSGDFDLGMLQAKVREIACVQHMHIQQYNMWQPRAAIKQRRQQWLASNPVNDLVKALLEFARYKKHEEEPLPVAELKERLLKLDLVKADDDLDAIGFDAVYDAYQKQLEQLYVQHDEHVRSCIDLPVYDALMRHLDTEETNRQRLLGITQTRNFDWQTDDLTLFVQECVLRESSVVDALKAMDIEVPTDTVAKQHYSRYFDSSAALTGEVSSANQLFAGRIRALLDTFRLSDSVVRPPADIDKVNLFIGLLDEVFARPLDKAAIHKLASTFVETRYDYLVSHSQKVEPMSDMVAVFMCMQPLVMQLADSITLQTDEQLHALVTSDFEPGVARAPFAGATGSTPLPTGTAVATVEAPEPTRGPSCFT